MWKSHCFSFADFTSPVKALDLHSDDQKRYPVQLPAGTFFDETRPRRELNRVPFWAWLCKSNALTGEVKSAKLKPCDFHIFRKCEKWPHFTIGIHRIYRCCAKCKMTPPGFEPGAFYEHPPGWASRPLYFLTKKRPFQNLTFIKNIIGTGSPQPLLAPR